MKHRIPRFLIRTTKGDDGLAFVRCRIVIGGKRIDFLTDVRMTRKIFRSYFRTDGVATASADATLAAQLAIWRDAAKVVAKDIPDDIDLAQLTNEVFATAVRRYVKKQEIIGLDVADSMCIHCNYCRPGLHGGVCTCPYMTAAQQQLAPNLAEECGACLHRCVGGKWEPAKHTPGEQLCNDLIGMRYGEK